MTESSRFRQLLYWVTITFLGGVVPFFFVRMASRQLLGHNLMQARSRLIKDGERQLWQLGNLATDEKSFSRVLRSIIQRAVATGKLGKPNYGCNPERSEGSVPVEKISPYGRNDTHPKGLTPIHHFPAAPQRAQSARSLRSRLFQDLQTFRQEICPEMSIRTTFGVMDGKEGKEFRPYSPSTVKNLREAEGLFDILSSAPENLVIGGGKLEAREKFVQTLMGPAVSAHAWRERGLNVCGLNADRDLQILVGRKSLWIHCTIPRAGLNQHRLMQKYVKRFNRHGKIGESLGVIALKKGHRLYIPNARVSADEIFPKFYQFLTSQVPAQETGNFLLLFKRFNSRLWGVYAFDQSAVLAREARPTEILTGVGLLFILVLAGFSLVYLALSEKPFISLRWKMAVIFLFANGLPLVLLAISGWDYLQQKKLALERETLDRVETALNGIESGYRHYYWGWEKSLKQISLKLESALAHHGKFRVETLRWLKAQVEIMPLRSFYLFSQKLEFPCIKGSRTDEAEIFPPGSIWPSGIPHGQLRTIPVFSKADLKEIKFLPAALYMGGRETNRDFSPPIIRTETLEMAAETLLGRSFAEILNLAFVSSNRFRLLGLGSSGKLWWTDKILTPQKDKIAYFVLSKINWEIIYPYLEETGKKLTENFPGHHFFALSDNDLIHKPSPEFFPPFANSNYQRLGANDMLRYRFRLGKQEFLLLGINSQEMQDTKLFSIVPLTPIENQIAQIRGRLIVFLALSLLFSLSIGQFLARKYLKPVSELERAVKAISRQEFENRPVAYQTDELGILLHSFGEVMVSLEELSLGKAVQESLFPGEPLTAGCFTVYGKSLPMGDLGGDYFDYFPIDSDTMGVLLGDVAGHGFPAAIVMAMAKGGIIANSDAWKNPRRMLDTLNKLILLPKERGRKLMMSGVFLNVDGSSGEIRLANAGQSYPVLYRHLPGTAEYLKLSSLPLGVLKKAKIGEWQGALNPGDALILYSDGPIETRGESNEETGYDNWKKYIIDSCHENLQTFHANLMKRHLDHRGSMPAQDDVTVVIIRRRL